MTWQEALHELYAICPPTHAVLAATYVGYPVDTRNYVILLRPVEPTYESGEINELTGRRVPDNMPRIEGNSIPDVYARTREAIAQL